MSPRLLLMSDAHLGGGTSQREDALADQAAALEEIVDLARDRRIDLLLNGGDTFHRPPASIPALHVWRRFTARLEDAGIPMVCVLGNSHDLAGTDAETAVELSRSELVRVSRHPEVIEAAGVAVCTLPSVPMGRLIAASDGGDRATIYERASDALLEIAHGLHASAREMCLQPVLLGHWMLDELVPAGLPAGAMNEPVLPVETLRVMGFDLVAFGHVHDGRDLGGGVVSIGAPICHGFGEEHVPHGVWLVDLNDAGVMSAEHVALYDRAFVTVDVDLTETVILDGLDETDEIAAQIAERGTGMDGAVVRVRWRATEEQHRRVDTASLKGLIRDLGGRPYQVAASEIVRGARARAEGMDEQLDPAECVQAWCEANHVTEAKTEALHTLTRELLEAIA
jgi:DNA repair protein SbcD/Mre11